MRRPGAAWTLPLLVVLAACSSSDDAAPSRHSVGESDGGADAGHDPTPAESCVRRGDKGNAIGVGEYCTPQGHQCAGFDGAPICLADVAQDQWFCTRVGCTTDDQCGAGAFCLHNPAGSACVLDRCQPKDSGTPDAH